MRRLAALLAALAAAAATGCGAPEPPAPPNVLLIVVDTLRADRLGSYGHPHGTSPSLDALAAEGTRYARAISHAPWTTPSMGALLSSRHPSALGIRDERSALPEGIPLLAEVLHQAGYATGAVVSHSFCSAKWGFARGFERFDESNIREQGAVTSPGVSDRGIEFLEAQSAGERPFFLMLHYYDPHFVYLLHEGFGPPGPAEPYTGPVRSGMKLREITAIGDAITRDDVAQLHRIYDSEIAFTDHHIGRVLDHLRAMGVWDRTLVVVTADHGEEFFDHGLLGHTKTLYEELLHVPLIVRYPGRDRRVVKQPVALIDVFPTVLAVAGLEAPPGLRGRSLLDVDEGEPVPIFSETSRQGELRSVVRGRHKLILDLRRGRERLHDLRADPGERRNLAAAQPQAARELRAELDRWMAEVEAGAEAARVELTDEERERLKALGYL